MHLDEYVARNGYGTLQRLRETTRLSYNLIYRASRREPVKTYLAAKAISMATGGAVSIAELCDPTPIALTTDSACGAY